MFNSCLGPSQTVGPGTGPLGYLSIEDPDLTVSLPISGDSDDYSGQLISGIGATADYLFDATALPGDDPSAGESTDLTIVSDVEEGVLFNMIFFDGSETPSNGSILPLGYLGLSPINFGRTVSLGYNYYKVGTVEVEPSHTIVLTHSIIGVKDHEESLIHNLTLTHSSIGDCIKNTNHTLSLTQNLTYEHEIPVSAYNNLSLSDLIQAEGLAKGESNLTLSHNASYVIEIVRSVDHTLTLTHAGIVNIDYERVVSHNLSFSDTASGIREIAESVFHNLTLGHSVIEEASATTSSQLMLTDTASSVSEKSRGLNQTLSLSQLVGSNIHSRTVAQNMSLTQSTQIINLGVRANNSLNLTHSVEFYTLTQSVGHNLSLSHSVSTDIKPLQTPFNNLTLTHSVAAYNTRQEVSHTLAFTQTVISNIKSESVSHTLDFEQIVLHPGSEFNRSVSDTITLSHEATKDEYGEAFNNLTLTQSVDNNKDYNQNIIFTDSASFDVVKPLAHSLNMTHSVSTQLEANLTLTHTLDFGSVVTFELQKTDLCQYNPQILYGTPFSTTPPTISPQNSTILTFPYITPTTTLTLRNPIFDNTEQRRYTRIIRETRGGTLKYFRDSSWTKSKRLFFVLDKLKTEEATSLLIFLRNSLGKEIGIRDFENRQWRGIILNPNTAIIQENRSFKTANIEFEGELA